MKTISNAANSPKHCDDHPNLQTTLMDIYHRMEDAFGDRGWWPASSTEEIIIGAILVQNVSWSNTVKAVERLNDHGLLTFPALAAASVDDIEACVYSTRFYKTKAKKLKAFATHVMTHHKGRIDAMLAQPMAPLRAELLQIYGIGPETADDILLYAANQASFVIDAYTKRIFYRLGLTPADISYESMRAWFMANLPADVSLFNQYHALLDAVGHHFCSTKRPKCEACPLRSKCLVAQGKLVI
ncbi:hypothetical protein JI721_15735 [Alicyclobacillus cycloheptanicus]|jgi:endonuclease-3 related protein|uniref:Endonuclease-3 related protein n=1 Tax=Alicyclobacillus cycloheptanicus TaxID=1457 RepID=A0ABT9XDK9_9BACL|nr:hypothetical protein [Alicyclobacillus cycloheptanicus]MDQ0188391.1 endonuclease-3 related protein [Alicyclobacillus cycloheptanicus]WDM01097.1 hypothetical protein JI721_15735 [Alicyclobacillus cycloheptanicus]